MNQTQLKSIQNLKNEITFKSICFAQLRECEINMAEIIYELFDTYILNLQDKISKKGYELAMRQAWVEDRPLELIPKSGSATKNVVKLRFTWEPIMENMSYKEVNFTLGQMTIVNKTLKKFSKDIGLDVELITDF